MRSLQFHLSFRSREQSWLFWQCSETIQKYRENLNCAFSSIWAFQNLVWQILCCPHPAITIRTQAYMQTSKNVHTSTLFYVQGNQVFRQVPSPLHLFDENLKRQDLAQVFKVGVLSKYHDASCTTSLKKLHLWRLWTEFALTVIEGYA